MLKFRPSNIAQKRNVSFNEVQLIALIEKGLSDNALRGFLYKRSSPTAKWRMKWFLLFENLLFYFDLTPTNQPGSSGKSPNKGSTLSSLIRRQSNRASREGAHVQRNSSSGPVDAEPRRASVSESLEIGRRLGELGTLGAGRCERGDLQPETARDGSRLGGQSYGGCGERVRGRKRLSSDPQSAAVSALDSLSLDYEHANSKTLHSSSISGVSGHFLAHNEQTIGRSTTTAGKTANSANYSSLLSRKIGVIFLEGSYCEKLIHSPANFSGGPRSMQMMSRSGGCKNSQGGGDLLEASQLAEHLASSKLAKNEENESELQCIFTLTWRKEGSKEYQFRTETEAECLTWTHAISNARYSTLLEEKEQLEQKYLHLSQIVESESTAKWQYSRQCEELSAEIKKLRQEICELKRQESRSNHLRLVLSKSAAIVESIVRQQRRKARQQQQQRLELDGALSEAAEEEGSSELGARPSSAEPVEQPVVQPTAAGSSAGGLLKRARSMDQEQAEQEMAVRRTARRSHLQRASAKADSQRRSEALSMLVRSASMRQSAGVECASLAAVTAAPTANESLDVELDSVVEALNKGILLSGLQFEVENGEELRKIKKVQGFFRGWLCRRRWKQIVQEYIKSPHAESMRKRNNLVFRMVECEEEYVEQLTQLISAFLRPIKMAASSQRPPLSHDELNSIFLNSETLLFLHQIFLKGLTARMESWPTLVLADLFNMLLPMLTIYQEYVRNHHFSLQVLAECKQRAQFAQLLRRLEEKSQLNGRTLETFLTYPMHQIPRYIICLHEILAHTPHNHVERKSLYEAQTKLEELSQQMHDEVSETENIRQNLAIERMIIGGCDILLDVNQVFVRQGILLQVLTEASKPARPRSRLASFASPRRSTADCQLPPHLPTNSAGYSHTNQSCDNQSRELVRQCFLFTNHLLLCTRTNDGKLHLLESVGRIELTEVTLIENPLEFIQQQEIMAAETAPNRNNRTKDSSCNSIWDYHSGCAPDGVASDKRASTASEPSKWPHTNQLETSRSRDKQQPAQVESHGLRVNSVFSVGASFSSPLEVTVPHETRQPGNSRGRIAGYLATKLSNLANLGGSGAQQQHRASGASSSAPPSPLNKRSNQELSANQTRRSTASALGERLLEQHKDYAGCDFILLLDSNSRSANHGSINGAPIMVHLVAPNLQEKAAWMSDISQCIDNVHFNDIFHGSVNDSTNVTMNQSVRNDPRLYKDDVDIKFSRTLNSCKLPQIRYASKERLFERLTDLRFLSIDFLNTFLLTYRVFTTAEDVLEALKSVHYNCDRYYQQQLCRESFSAFDYSSLSSLNNSTQTVEAVNKAQLGVDQKAEASPKIVSPVPVVLSDKRKDIELHHRSRRPTVPVRSSAKEAIFIGQNEGTKFLLAPNCLHQKRRSTISALTPITGSTSSSLANLSSTHKTNLQQPSSNPVPAANLESNTLVNRGDNSCQSNNDLTLFNNDNQKQLNLTPDRCSPSSSMIQTEHSDFEMQVKTNLDVPGRGRQVRASSLSHVSGAQLREAVRRDQNQDNSIGSEHWRLSYKKAIDSSSTLAAKNLLSAAKCGPTRRASSSDANITFHITLEPPPVETKVSDDEFASSRSCYHSVPPPSPSGPPSDASQLSSLKRPSSNRTTAKDRTSLSDKNITNDKLPVDMNETSVHNSRRIKKRHHHHRKRRLNRHNSDSSLTTNDSSTQLSSSSISTGSVISSQSESDLIQSTSSRDSTDSDSSKPERVDTVNNLSENRVDVPIRSARRQQSMPFTVKEIELTESKTLDCDTSADEDKVSTSSGDEHNRILSDSDDQEYDYENEDDESFRLLSRLNSVKISKREFECDKPCLEPDKKSVGSSDAQKTSKAAKDRMTEEVTTGKRRRAKRRTNKIKKSGKLRRSVKTSNKKGKTPASAEQTYPSSDTIVHNDAVQLDVMADISSSGTKELTNELKPCFDVTAVIDDTSKVETQHKETQSEQASEVGYVSQRLHNSNVGLQSSDPGSRMTTPRNSFQYHNADVADRISKAGVIVTSSSPRVSSRRSSTASAASAFAAATAASNNPLLTHPPQSLKTSSIASSPRKLSSDIQRHNFDPSNQTDAISCLCFNFQRQPLSAQSSNQTLVGNQLTRIQSRQSELINNRVSSANSSGTTAGQQQQLSMAHHPSCIYFQQLAACSPSNTPSNYCPNMPSDASLCNSRASSRLSSCAGLDYSTYSSQTNFYTMQHQQQHFAPSSNQVGSPVHIRGQQQTVRGCHATQQARLGTYLENRTVTNNSSKRNSSQINIRSVATIRVLSVLRHWVSKHSQDFVNDTKLTNLVQEFIQDLIMDPNLLPAEHKAAIQLQQMVQKANQLRGNRVDLDVLLASPSKPSPDSIETLSALEVAETMTYLDHKIFLAIRSEEFLGQAWMKLDKAIKAPHILLITKRFNDVSRLVSSEIIRVPELSRRVAIIEKWANVAHICRVVHNFNGVLQICAAFTNSAVFRLEKTWDKIPKTTKTTIDQLQSLVSTDSRFRNMRDAINRCDPPSIPYVGMYLTDLSFIEEGTPNYSPEGLLNFSKMRMIAHVIREIQHLQNGSYKIELNHRVANYLLDSSRHLQDDEMYRCSLAIEPRSTGGKNGVHLLNNAVNQQAPVAPSVPAAMKPSMTWLTSKT